MRDLVLFLAAFCRNGVQRSSEYGIISSAYLKKQGILKGAVFCTASGRPVDSSNIWREMKALCGAARVGTEDENRFSEDVAKDYYSGGTVTYMVMQIAVYMGLREIYLLGVDHNYSVERKIKTAGGIRIFFQTV